MPQSGMTDEDLVNVLSECLEESRQGRFFRDELSDRNWDMYMGKQDFSDKIDGQSTEFIPKVTTAVEQLGSFIKKGLHTSEKFFDVEFRHADPIPPEVARKLLMYYFSRIPSTVSGQETTNIQTIISDAVKVASLSSLLILKVYPHFVRNEDFHLEPGAPVADPETGIMTPGPMELSETQQDTFRISVDLIDPKSYFPDPSGNNLYEIHRVERDWHTVMEKAEQGFYDKKKVQGLMQMELDIRDKQKSSHKNQTHETRAKRRKTVVIDEFWGTILNQDGSIAYKNVFMTIANSKVVIRKPTKNPFFHNSSPFIVSPIIRVPFSVWHRALMDPVASLNSTLNELFNLMVDGGIAKVWGTRQLRIDDLADVTSISNGIPQGATLRVKSSLPPGTKVMENVTNGEVPAETLALYELIQGELAQGSLSNDLRLGSLPKRNVLATEINEISSSQDVMMENLLSNLDKEFITKLIRKSWLLLVQYFDRLDPMEIAPVMGPGNYLAVKQSTERNRFIFMGGANFKVFGLTSVMTRSREFTKMMALLQAVGQNPILLRAFVEKNDPIKVLSQLEKLLNIDPANLERPEAIQVNMQEEIAKLSEFAQLLGGNGGSQAAIPGVSGEGSGGNPQLAAAINQNVNPATGLTVNN